MPSNDAQVAAHFSTNPIIGICLKRYGCTNQGVPYRSKTIVDIPLEIALPYFIQDDRAEQDTSLFRDFKMVLQAIVCHRGESTNAGHYVSVVRALASNNKMGKSETSPPQQPGKEGPPGYRDDAWFILDDLANIRVKPVNIERLLQDEMPYLLFYQVQPMLNNETQPQGMPPPYQAKDTLHQRAVQSLGSSHDSSGFGESLAAHGPSLTQESSPSAGSSQVVTPNEDVPQLNGISLTLEAASPTREGQFTSDQKSDWQLLLNDTVDTSRLSISSITASPRVSFSAAHAERLRASFSETDIAQEALKPPNEKEQLGRRLSRAASKFSLNGKKRQTSRTDEARKSGTFSRFNPMKSKDSSSKEKEQVKTAENSSADASKAASLVDIAALDGVRDSKAGNGSKPLTSDEKARGEVFIIGDDDVPRKITADDLGNKNRKQHHRFRSGEKGEPSDDPGSKKVPDRECSMM